MSEPTRRLLLRALLDADGDAAATAGRAWLEAIDVQTLGWDQARMLPMAYKRLSALGVEEMPEILRGTYRKAWVQNQARFRAAAVTLAEFDAAGIANLVTKGAALVPAYGGDWGVRDMSDVDVLVPVEQLPHAAALLAKGGCILRGTSPMPR